MVCALLYKELTAWRAQLRPFLVNAEGVSHDRPLEPLSGSKLNQGLCNLTTEGERRRKALYESHSDLQKGQLPDHRTRQNVVSIVVDEPSGLELNVSEVDEDDFHVDIHHVDDASMCNWL